MCRVFVHSSMAGHCGCMKKGRSTISGSARPFSLLSEWPLLSCALRCSRHLSSFGHDLRSSPLLLSLTPAPSPRARLIPFSLFPLNCRLREGRSIKAHCVLIGLAAGPQSEQYARRLSASTLWICAKCGCYIEKDQTWLSFIFN